MKSPSPLRRWSARFGVATVAAFAVGAPALAAPALAAPALAAHAEPYVATGQAFAADAVLAVGSTGKPITVTAFGHDHVDPLLTIDTTGLAGVATVELPEECKADAGIARCAIPVEEYSYFSLWPVPADGAVAGATGTLVYTITGAAGTSTQTTSRVTLADGPDLAVFYEAEPEQTVAAGAAVTTPVSIYNAGGTATGATLSLRYMRGITPPYVPGCSYVISRDDWSTSATCPIAGQLEPGVLYVLDSRLPADVAGDGLGRKTVLVSVTPAAVSESGLTVHEWAARRAAPDVDSSDNALIYGFDVQNTHDLRVTGDTATGAVGDVVTVTVGVTNAGLATLDPFDRGPFVVAFAFKVPQGTTAVSVPSECLPVVDGSANADVDPVGHAVYLCGLDKPVFGVAEPFLRDFGLRINQEAAAGLTGEVALNAPTHLVGALDDANAANNTAAVTITALAAAVDGGAGGGETLPVTGAKVTTLMLGGFGLVALGVLALYASRRVTA